MGLFVVSQFLAKLIYMTKHAHNRNSSKWKFWILEVWLSLCLAQTMEATLGRLRRKINTCAWKQLSLPESTESSRTGYLNHGLRRRVCSRRDTMEVSLFFCLSVLFSPQMASCYKPELRVDFPTEYVYPHKNFYMINSPRNMLFHPLNQTVKFMHMTSI